MTRLGDIGEHLTLVRRMARAADVDLVAAMSEGEFANEDWAAMVTNCRACACVDACHGHLASLEMGDRRSAAPEFCENRATFDRLAR